MNNTPPKENTNNQEIDLAFLFNSLKNFVDNIGFTIYRIINFYLRNFIVTIILILLGVGLGYYQYVNNKKSYKHELIVVPNFNSTGYLYNKVGGIGKSDQNDNSPLSHISEAKIEPIVDVFEFVSDNKQNLEIAKYMSENTIEISKFKKDNDVEKLYKYHLLTYYTDVADVDSKILNALIETLNNDIYLNERKKVEVLETQNKLVEYQNSVDNINKMFTYLSGGVGQSNAVNISMYSQINDLMLTKNELLKTINKTKIELIEQEKIIFDASNNLNNTNSSFIKIIAYPILFNLLFLILAWFTKQFKRYKLRIQS